MSNCIDINDNNFEFEVLGNHDTPVLVDFWAPWCHPCKIVSPVLEEISIHYGSKLKVVKINVEKSPSVAKKNGIRGVPTLMLFVKGNLVKTEVGIIQKSQLISVIDQYM